MKLLFCLLIIFLTMNVFAFDCSLPDVRKLPLSFMADNEKITLQNNKITLGETDYENGFNIQDFILKDYNLKIRAYYKIYKEYDCLEYYFRFENTGDVNSPQINNIFFFDDNFSNNNNFIPIVHYALGGGCSKDDFAPVDTKLRDWQSCLLWTEGAHSSGRFLPFFNLRMSDENYMFAIGWSGSWESWIRKTNWNENMKKGETENIEVSVYMPECDFYLKPGESVRGPKIMVMSYEGEQIDGQNKLRRHIFANHNHYKRQTGREELPVFSINWGDVPCDYHIENIKNIVENDLDVDCYWIDAAWFGKHKEWAPSVGDWIIKNHRYPNGFKPITDLLKENNKQFLLWFEPERVCNDTDFERLDSWLIRPKTEKFLPKFANMEQINADRILDERNAFQPGDRLINFADPEAVDYYIKYFSDYIKNNKIDIYRHDANIAPQEHFRALDEEKRTGITEMKWIEGLYRYFDGLMAQCPGLVIDNCSAGGRRMDLEMIDRSVATTRTDCSWDDNFKQNHSLGINEWFMFHTATEGARLMGQDAKDFEYKIASNMGLGIILNLSYTNDQEKNYFVPKENYNIPAIKDVLKKYRKMQPYFKYDYYPLSSYSSREDAVICYEFYSPEKDKGLLVFIKRETSDIDSATYEIKCNKDKKYKFEYVMGKYPLKLTGNRLNVKFGDKHSVCCVLFK